MKLEEYMYRSQLPRMKDIMTSYESAVNILIQLQDEDRKYKVSEVQELTPIFSVLW